MPERSVRGLAAEGLSVLRVTLGKAQNREEEGREGGSIELGRVGSAEPPPDLCAPPPPPAFGPGERPARGLPPGVPPRVTPAGLPYLASSPRPWAGRWSAGVGVPEEDAQSRPRGWARGKRGGDLGWAAPSRPDPFHTPHQTEAVSRNHSPFRRREGKSR